ncbi:ATP-binding protein [Alcaligenes faecalis]|uniref:helicase HerA-like domain-containing protein n=1 Tax=Alcaligenes faecalis TaxID=511 RepID=UPI000A2D7064|nr:helicase HerA-like domain-containing protein [Alcaligenes faecalis]OSZ32687.1 ATP-binding protein [Alcaligenes faecalis]OSZ41453.1 ATP-binding protein [Alcaligenes faecalis]
MADPILLAQNSNTPIYLLPALANRHGCITGATGTGKTVTLQVLAEAFSRQGTPVFLADAKGDLSGISQAAQPNPKLQERLQKLGLPEPAWGANPVTFWDIFGEQGHPVRATISDMGPLLLAQILELNDTQEGILNILFRVADDEGQLILDLKDLRALLQDISDRAAELRGQYGNIAAASVGAIQRALLRLETQGADRFFGEPALDVMDWIRTDSAGRGMINVLAADKLMQSPRLYAVFLLWMLADLYERLPEVGDLDKPRLVFFFDEAHLLFTGAPKALLEKVEQVVRLIRSKGVGIYFVTQNPLDIPDTVLGQLGNRVQHALRAFTPRDQKAVKTAAQTMRPNPGLDIEAAITELGVGEALVSMLDAKGIPTPTERAWLVAPGSRIGPATDAERQTVRQASLFGLKYDQAIDRESAYEVLAKKATDAAANGAAGATQAGGTAAAKDDGLMGVVNDFLFGSTGPRGGKKDGLVQSMIKTETKRAATKVLRGVLGSLFGGKR